MKTLPLEISPDPGYNEDELADALADVYELILATCEEEPGDPLRFICPDLVRAEGERILRD